VRTVSKESDFDDDKYQNDKGKFDPEKYLAHVGRQQGHCPLSK